MLIKPNEPIQHIYFHESGYSSVVAGGNGSAVELGMIGREGCGIAGRVGLRPGALRHLIQLPVTGFG